MNSRCGMTLAAVAVTSLLAGPLLAADQPEGEAEGAASVAKQLSNPVADLVSIPFQFNWDSGVGENDGTRSILNVQPVVPLSISKDWNLIGRFILPFVSQPAGLAPGSPAVSGTGDITLSTFFSPKKSKIIWGAGPVFGLPTSTDPLLGSGHWSAGPTVVVLKQSGPWTYGGLANHLWSFADTAETGDDGIGRADVSTSFVQPFLAYTTKTAVTYSLQSESTYNWEAEDDKWTAPVNFLVSKVARLGPFPFSLQGGGGYYLAKPDAGPDWRLRMAFTIILPRGK